MIRNEGWYLGIHRENTYIIFPNENKTHERLFTYRFGGSHPPPKKMFEIRNASLAYSTCASGKVIFVQLTVTLSHVAQSLSRTISVMFARPREHNYIYVCCTHKRYNDLR